MNLKFKILEIRTVRDDIVFKVKVKKPFILWFTKWRWLLNDDLGAEFHKQIAAYFRHKNLAVEAAIKYLNSGVEKTYTITVSDDAPLTWTEFE